MRILIYILSVMLILGICGCDSKQTENIHNVELNQPEDSSKEQDSLDKYISGNTDISPYYKPEVEVNDEKVEYIPPTYDINTYKYLDIKINSVKYTLRESTIQDFINGGFEIKDTDALASISGNSTRQVTNSYEYIDVYFNKDSFNKNFKCTLKYWNDNSNIDKCIVYGILIDTMELNNIPEIELENSVKFGDYSTDIIKQYGNPKYVYEQGVYDVLNYENDDYSFKMKLMVHYKYGLSIANIEI